MWRFHSFLLGKVDKQPKGWKGQGKRGLGFVEDVVEGVVEEGVDFEGAVEEVLRVLDLRVCLGFLGDASGGVLALRGLVDGVCVGRLVVGWIARVEQLVWGGSRSHCRSLLWEYRTPLRL